MFIAVFFYLLVTLSLATEIMSVGLSLASVNAP